jgi:hypothetical protein
MENKIIPEVIDTIIRLPRNLQEEVLAYVRKLKKAHDSAGSGKSLLDFAGSILEEDLKIMSKVIEEDCGRIDLNKW